ncbi:hypothetical protein ACFSHQ_04810 [Gemmobacter lanyuensis]
MPKRFEETLVEVFPEHAPGNFTHYPDFGKWVWTTFNEHQWDLNWANPEVFLEITQIMLFLANQGWMCCGWMRWPSCGNAWAPAASQSRRST